MPDDAVAVTEAPESAHPAEGDLDRQLTDSFAEWNAKAEPEPEPQPEPAEPETKPERPARKPTRGTRELAETPDFSDEGEADDEGEGTHHVSRDLEGDETEDAEEKKPAKAQKRERADKKEGAEEDDESDKGERKKAKSAKGKGQNEFNLDRELEDLEKMEPPPGARPAQKADWSALKTKAKAFKLEAKQKA